MKLYKTKNRFSHIKVWASVLLFLLAAGLFYMGFSNTSKGAEEESLKMTQRALEKAVVNCYAVEGAYPADVSYLEEHYGLLIDHEKYVITYESIGSNIRPYCKVTPIGQQNEEMM